MVYKYRLSCICQGLSISRESLTKTVRVALCFEKYFFWLVWQMWHLLVIGLITFNHVVVIGQLATISNDVLPLLHAPSHLHFPSHRHGFWSGGCHSNVRDRATLHPEHGDPEKTNNIALKLGNIKLLILLI